MVILTESGEKERIMASLLQSALYLGGSMAFFGLLVLPILFLLAISLLYLAAEAVWHFRERRGSF